MDINTFIENFAEACDDLDINDLRPDTNFRDLDDWSSVCALSLIAMIDEEYDQELSGQELRSASTIQDLFDIVNSKL